jgi:hypothetical protein
MGYVGKKPTDAPLTSSDIGDGQVTAAKLGTDAVETAKVKDLNVTVAKLPATVDVSSKTVTLPASVGGLGTGIDVTSQITGVVPAANLGSGTASSSTYLAGDSTYKTISEYDDNQVQSNIAMLGFKVAINGSLAKYNLVDQAIDEYEDTSGVDASASTNEVRAGSAGAYYYSGTAASANDADDTGTDGDYTWYKWTDTAATGSITPAATLDVEYLMVGGGGSSGVSNGGGGGAGGVITATGLELTGDAAYTVTVGDGGTTPGSGVGDDGGSSILSGSGISTLTAGGGGGGGAGSATNGRAGVATNGSGGGGAFNNNGGTGDGTGGTGGSQSTGGPNFGSGGGGGAGADGTAGDNNNGGDGGDGVTNDIIETGTDVYYGGGGGGSVNGDNAAAGDGGNGGGGAGVGAGTVDGTDGLGGGGGGGAGSSGGDGGSGVVILRGLTSELNISNDLTLQSTDTTASTANPDYGELVCLIENAAGTATLNTDIKGYVSEDSGVTFTQGTFVDEGSWGTNKKIIAFHDLDISAQSGSSMCYKITTHNQSASLDTRIYATSLGWR